MPTLADRRTRMREVVVDAGAERILLAGNGHHMIDLANAVAHTLGYRSVGPALLIIESDLSLRLLTSPRDELDALEGLDLVDCYAVDDIGAELCDFLGSATRRTATVGVENLPRRLAQQVQAALGNSAIPLDASIYAATAAKTDDEIAAARRATAIAEAGYRYMLDTVRPGMRECDLAVGVNRYMREQGANDSFLMLNCGPRADAVMPSSERPIEAGDLLLCELSPSLAGQFTQICRTVSIGEPAAVLPEKYRLLAEAMREGISRAKPGVCLGDVCQAIDDYLSEAGYQAFSRPPFIRRRGHGLGSGSTAPGDVSVDNETVLQPGMLFMVHPNQFLPETGYMMCGEPVLVTQTDAVVLTGKQAALAVVESSEFR